MGIRLMPKTNLGRWSIWLIIGFFVFLGLFYLAVALGQRGGETFFSNLILTIPILLAGVSGILSFFTGITSIVKSKERSVLVFLATVLGLFVLFFVMGEILFPH